jgi:hypothetical protein
MTTARSENLTLVFRYAERGLRVFPVARREKGPCHGEISSWTEEATTDETQIRQWFGQSDPPNVGVATGVWEGNGELFAADIDLRDSGDDETIDGHETWNNLQAEQEEPVPETLTVDTPSGGTHHYFRVPPGVEIKSANDNLGDGVDTKGHGGYVVAPPSTTEAGAYTFRKDASDKIAPAPSWLVSMASKQKPNVVTNASSKPPPPSVSHPNDFGNNHIEEALQAIPPNPDYDKWIRIIAAVKDAVDSDREAARLLEKWSPEDKHGDYTYEERLENAPNREITAGTLFYYAQKAGWAPPSKKPPSHDARGDGRISQPPHPAGSPHPVDPDQSPNGNEPEASLDDLDLQTAPEILAEDFDPLQPLVTYEERTVLPEGTSILAAKPKIGKTFLAMNTAVGIASGGKALGRGSVREGRVLYLNPDGSKRGTQSRLDTMFEQEPGGPPEKLHMVHGEYPVVGEGGLDLLDQWCQLHPDTELVIIDTLQHLRPPSSGRRNLYEEDYEFLSPITRLGRRHATSILSIHHLNKSVRGDDLDRISGSLGLSGAVESALLLERERESTEAILKVRPREARDDEFHLEFDPTLLTWRLGGVPTPGTKARKEIWDVVLAADGAIQLKEIAKAVGSAASTVSEHLNSLKTEDKMPLERTERGRYRAA